MKKFMTYATNHKGVTLVLMAIMLAVLIMLASLAIDISYMYFAKNQLQVAADAAALAGAGKLDGSASLIQEPARRAAWKFACKNNAAGSKVFLVTDTQADCDSNNPPTADQLNANTGTNTNTDINGDIVMGYWDGSSFSPTVTPPQIANAVKVVARRTGETPGMPQVGLFLGKIFQLIGSDWSVMAVTASAIAARPPRPSTGLVFCQPICEAGINLDIPFSVQNQDPDPEVNKYSVSYTEFGERTPLGKQTCIRANDCPNAPRPECSTDPDMKIASFLWQLNIAPVQCIPIRWDNGVGNLLDDLACAFSKTNFDADNKKDASGNSPPQGPVASWKVIVPISQSCPSGAIPGNAVTEGTSTITHLAEITIVDMLSANDTSVLFDNGNKPKKVKISEVECFPCGDWTHVGSKPALVK